MSGRCGVVGCGELLTRRRSKGKGGKTPGRGAGAVGGKTPARAAGGKTPMAKSADKSYHDRELKSITQVGHVRVSYHNHVLTHTCAPHSCSRSGRRRRRTLAWSRRSSPCDDDMNARCCVITVWQLFVQAMMMMMMMMMTVQRPGHCLSAA